jgi:type II secretory ATPase GspE/PulE/Tfp pilus assembly ATPase PilB-like protein
LAVHEVFVLSPPVRDAMQTGASEAELYALATHSGMINLFTDGVFKCVAGYTTIEEVYKTVVLEG